MLNLNRLQLFNRGQTYEAQGAWAAAETCYRKAGATRAQARMARRRTEDSLAEQLIRAITAREESGGERPMTIASQIERLTNREAPFSADAAAEWLDELGSDQDPITCHRQETTARDLAYDRNDIDPATTVIWFYGETGWRRGTLHSMILDRLKLRRLNVLARREKPSVRTCSECGQKVNP